MSNLDSFQWSQQYSLYEREILSVFWQPCITLYMVTIPENSFVTATRSSLRWDTLWIQRSHRGTKTELELIARSKYFNENSSTTLRYLLYRMGRNNQAFYPYKKPSKSSLLYQWHSSVNAVDVIMIFLSALFLCSYDIKDILYLQLLFQILQSLVVHLPAMSKKVPILFPLKKITVSDNCGTKFYIP